MSKTDKSYDTALDSIFQFERDGAKATEENFLQGCRIEYKSDYLVKRILKWDTWLDKTKVTMEPASTSAASMSSASTSAPAPIEVEERSEEQDEQMPPRLVKRKRKKKETAAEEEDKDATRASRSVDLEVRQVCILR